ncbi:hypothetical protein I550_4372 [Mycobacterium intracellulare 1956]|uniref:Uncharacterized protein n=1 Tax=Mycobacterium intracellulare 1956 TaxID=1299331 RepID=X8CL89_MYCIT|nr:hypothetical protein I550_4372 [Mycobacterium intracellulare 1956]
MNLRRRHADRARRQFTLKAVSSHSRLRLGAERRAGDRR